APSGVNERTSVVGSYPPTIWTVAPDIRVPLSVIASPGLRTSGGSFSVYVTGPADPGRTRGGARPPTGQGSVSLRRGGRGELPLSVVFIVTVTTPMVGGAV